MSRRKKGDPCGLCMERDFCQKAGLPPCRRKEAYDRYKAKCKEIAEHTREIMERAKHS